MKDPRILIGTVVTGLFLAGLYGVTRTATEGGSISTNTPPRSSEYPGAVASPGATGTTSQAPDPDGTNPPGNGKNTDREKAEPKNTGGNRDQGDKPRPHRRAIRVGGATLVNRFAATNLDQIIFGGVPLGIYQYCGLLHNETDLELKVTRTAISVAAGKARISTGCENYGLHYGVPAGSPECRGARVPAGTACWVGIEMTTLPSSPSSGSISWSVSGTCASTVSTLCAGITDPAPSAASPVDVVNTQSYPFTTEAAESPTPSSQPSPSSPPVPDSPPGEDGE